MSETRVTWKGLTPAEQDALCWVSRNPGRLAYPDLGGPTLVVRQRLRALGLSKATRPIGYTLTPMGKTVLAEAGQ